MGYVYLKITTMLKIHMQQNAIETQKPQGVRRGAKMSLTLNEPIQNLFKPPHDLQTCTKNLPNMEDFVSKTTNSISKVKMS